MKHFIALAALVSLCSQGNAQAAPDISGVFPKIEASFALPNLESDPFDYTKTDVQEDAYHHLITTSSDEAIHGLFDDMDYLQHHDYPNDIIGHARNAPSASLHVAVPDFGGAREPHQNRAGSINCGAR